MEICALQGITDPLVPAWFRLYELSFRQEVRGLAGFLLQLLRESPRHSFLAAVQEGELLGLALYELPETVPVGYLWYLAVQPQRRGQGIGTQLYRAVLERLPATAEALFLDVELPEHEPTAEGSAYAAWRISFYQHLGAWLLPKVRVWEQVAPHFPPVPLGVFAHPLRTHDPLRLLTLATTLYGPRLERLDEPGLKE